MSANVFGARGLYTSPSYITNAPPGASVLDTNVVIDVPGERTTRRGFERLAEALPGGIAVSSWTWFQGVLVAHAGTGLYRYNGSAWTAYSGTYSPPVSHQDPGTGADVLGKVRFSEYQQTLYITTAAGVYRLESATGTPVLAGVTLAITGTATLPGTVGSMLPEGQAVAYRYVWGRRAENGRIHYGVPSDRVVVENVPTAAKKTLVSASRAVTTVTVTATAHGYAINDVVRLVVDEADAVDFPPGDKVVTSVPTADTFTYEEAGAATSMGAPASATVQEVPPTQDVNHVVPIPSGVDSTHFFQAYRSVAADVEAGPSDEVFLVYERAYSDLPTGATSVSFTDKTPDALLADALYTNVNTGGGITTAHHRPPLAVVQHVFKGRTFYGNVEFVERTSLTLLSTDSASGGLVAGQGIRLKRGTTFEDYFAISGTPVSLSQFQVFTDGTPAQNVARTVQSLVATINAGTTGMVWGRVSGVPGELPGKFTLESRVVSSDPITIQTLGSSTAFVPAVPALVYGGAMTRAAGVVTVSCMQPVSLVVGQQIEFTRAFFGGASAFPLGVKTVASVPGSNTFTYNEAGADFLGPVAPYQIEFLTVGPEVTTDDEAAPGGWVPSALNNPDGIPTTLPEVAGDRYKRLLRFLQLGDSLFMLKEDGLFRLTGDGPESFNVEHVDSTVTFVAPEAALVVGATAYAMTTQGLMQWTESSRPVPASVPIESDLRTLAQTARTALDRYAFAISHDAKRRAMFFLPSSSTDTSATQAYVYNTLTDAWTRWDKAATTAVVEPSVDRLFIAPPAVGGVAPAPARERNSGTNADFQDEDGEPIVATVRWTPFYGSGPNTEKQYSWFFYHFAGAVPSQVEVAFSTPLKPTPQWFTLTGQNAQTPGTMQTPPTLDHSRGRNISVLLRHGQVGVPLRMLGFGVKFREFQAR